MELLAEKLKEQERELLDFIKKHNIKLTSDAAQASSESKGAATATEGDGGKGVLVD